MVFEALKWPLIITNSQNYVVAMECDWVVIREGPVGGMYIQMPLHYPRYTKAVYETIPEWKIDILIKEYGLPVSGDIAQKRQFAMGTKNIMKMKIFNNSS
ncbi:hypothetical protein MKX01_027934 [Papaver californicum]|nr:hypothetical protein MKX01_017617 [Papaver californicum]KAI3977657.1 hypothetical protein MKX01_036816 [Papaver californicum]KAI3989367.1 hypothetical protein MKX01_027934 [Papaver californicum]